MCLNRPGSIGAEVDTVIVWSSIKISACSTRPTSQGSGAYTDLVAPGTVQSMQRSKPIRAFERNLFLWLLS